MKTPSPIARRRRPRRSPARSAPGAARQATSTASRRDVVPVDDQLHDHVLARERRATRWPGRARMLGRIALNRCVTVARRGRTRGAPRRAVASVWPADDRDAAGDELVDQLERAGELGRERDLATPALRPAAGRAARGRARRSAGTVVRAEPRGERNGPSRCAPSTAARSPSAGIARSAATQRVLGRGDERRLEGGRAGGQQRLAGAGVARRGRPCIEVDAGEAVDLEVDESRRGDPASRRRAARRPRSRRRRPRRRRAAAARRPAPPRRRASSRHRADQPTPQLWRSGPIARDMSRTRICPPARAARRCRARRHRRHRRQPALHDARSGPLRAGQHRRGDRQPRVARAERRRRARPRRPQRPDGHGVLDDDRAVRRSTRSRRPGIIVGQNGVIALAGGLSVPAGAGAARADRAAGAAPPGPRAAADRRPGRALRRRARLRR